MFIQIFLSVFSVPDTEPRLSMFSACGENAIESTDRIGVCGHDLWGLVMWHMGLGKEVGGSEGGY